MPTISDLFEYRNPHFMLPIQSWMEQRGLELIDSGAKAAVFRNKTGEIVKVFDKDPCYRAFVGLVKKHPDNPHFPRLRQIGQFTHPQLRGASMIKMEPLEPLTGREYFGNLGLHCYIIIEHNMFNYGNRLLYVDHIPMQYISEILGGDPMRDSVALNKARQLADEFRQKEPLLAKAIDLVLFNNQRPCHIDLHAGNFMKRGSVWVITDPFID